MSDAEHLQMPADDASGQAGLAHVATASFLASRVVPSGGFVVALAGGVALARAALCAGARTGFGASLAAMFQTVAVMGPARIGIPLTQAISAPMLGRQHARGCGFGLRFATCATVRLLHSFLSTAFYIWIILGGLDVYAGTYDSVLGKLPFMRDGEMGALLATTVTLLVWTVAASVLQVKVYRRGLIGWPADPGEAPTSGGEQPPPAAARPPRFDPRAVAVSALVAFAVLLASTEWTVLAAVGAWLVVAWVTARADRAPVRSGIALAATLALGALAFGLVSGAGVELTLQRTTRAALLVLVATWLRAAAGEEGLREVARRALHRARRLPSAAEASAILDNLGARGSLAASGRALGEIVGPVPRRPTALAGAVRLWMSAEAASFAPALARTAPAPLRTRPRDRVLIALVFAAASTLTLPVS